MAVFFGTPEFAVRILDILKNKDFVPALIITTPDKPRGRGKKITPTPAKIWAQSHNIEVWQPEKLRDPEFLKKLRDLFPDLFIIASYGKIIPQELLDIPKFGALNVHPSLLPLHRGPAPIEEAILAGDKETGVTIMLVDAEMDHGPILAQRRLGNSVPKLKFSELETRLAKLGGELLANTIPRWLAGTVAPREQNHALATYTKKITKEDGHLNWQLGSEEISRRILALNPWPGTYSLIDRDGHKERLIISEINILPNGALNTSSKSGEVLAYESGFGVTTGNGRILVLRVKPEGKNEMTAADYLRGHRDIIGKILN